MKFSKPALSSSKQADLLLSRGLVADKIELIQCLESVSYYRLSAYWYTFRIPNDPENKIIPGTNLNTVWRRYTFDRQLRMLVMDAIERVEIALRTQIINRHVMAFGPFGYLDRINLPGINVNDHRKMLEKIRTEAGNSREEFVQHFFGKYTSETDLPLWKACELITFGIMLTLFMGLNTHMKKEIAQHYNLTVPVLGSWLRMLNQVRNICAHHSRLWNRLYGVNSVMPDSTNHPEWYQPVPIGNKTTFTVLTILKFFLKNVAPHSHWKNRLENLFSDYNDIPFQFMGFPKNWRESPIWK